MTEHRVLVTGATGFVGRPTVDALAASGAWEVHACARRPDRTSAQGVHWHQADLLAPDGPESLFQLIRPTHLVHLAWHVEPGAFWTDPGNVGWVEATLRLARAFTSAGGRRMLAVGSCAEYGPCEGSCMEATTPLRPSTLYGACKSATGQVLQAWGSQVGVDVVWARLFNLFGPREAPGRLVPDIVSALRAGEPVALSAGTQVRDYMHVSDAAAALVHVLSSDLVGAVNVGSGRGVAVREVAETLGEVLGRPELLMFGQRTSAPDDAAGVVADVTRLRSSGWQPRLSLREGLLDTAEDGRERAP